ncbi:MAG: exodeoxyribonuclease V subunit alpha [Dermatophilaceae bacterium]
MSTDAAPLDSPYDRRLARAATGLCREANGAGVLVAADVHVAGRVAAAVGERDEEALLAVALAVRAVRQGSVCVDLTGVRELAPSLPWPGDGWTERVLGSRLAAAGVLHVEHGLVYLDRYWREERQVCDDLVARLTDAGDIPPERLDAALAEHFPGPHYGEQRAAARTACTRLTSVVTGGPGTGKTTTIARLLGTLYAARGPSSVALAAPTGKAAARLAQAVTEEARKDDFPAASRAAVTALSGSTIHRLLGWRPGSTSRFRHDRGNQLPHDVVVVDETSMVSLTLMARLLEAVRPGARLVLVGDPDQLASVEAGAVLKDLVEGLGAGSPVVGRLRTSHRFGGAIAEIAAAVNAGDTDAAVRVLDAGGDVARTDDPQRSTLPAARRLVAAADAGDRRAALDVLDEHRLLCAHRSGPYGASHWNRQVEGWLKAELGVDWLPRWYAGQPLLVTTNDYGSGLFNGDTGVVVRGVEHRSDLFALVADGVHADGRELPLGRLADVVTAHAMTVHRSQGSQFDAVTLILPEGDSPLLTRELFYTAVTRARHTVRVHGSTESVRAAMGRRAHRATGLAARMRARLERDGPRR